MRIWKGKEKEILMFRGKEMLFIQGEKVNISVVLGLAVQNKINQLYFGAGRTEFKDFKKLKIVPKKYKVIIETTNPHAIPATQNLTIIHRIDSDKIQKNTILKLENKSQIMTSYNSIMFTTDKQLLNPETLMYEGDELLWEDKKWTSQIWASVKCYKK